MADALISNYTDELARQATITIQTGTPPDDVDLYGPSALVDDNPAKLARIESTTGAWLLSFDAPVHVGAIALAHHNFETDADVRIQANITDDWATPPLDLSITIPAWRGTGVRRWPVNPWRLLPPSVLIIDVEVSAFQYWRLIVTGNAANLRLGQLRLHPSLSPLVLDRGLKVLPEKPLVDNPTAYGASTPFSRGTTRWAASFDLGGLEAAEQAALEAQWYDVDGRARPFVFVPDTDVNACYLVRWSTRNLPMEFVTRAWGRVQTGVEEVARGLRP